MIRESNSEEWEFDTQALRSAKLKQPNEYYATTVCGYLYLPLKYMTGFGCGVLLGN